jgi:hypothetical protein
MEKDSHTCGRTDVHTDGRTGMMKLVVAFFNFTKMPKMYFPCPPHEGIEEELRSFVACALDKGECLNSWSGHFMSRMKPRIY